MIVAVGVSNRYQETRDTQHMTFFLPFFCLFCYCCYYPHLSRDSVSPECGILFFNLCEYKSMLCAISKEDTVFSIQ